MADPDDGSLQFVQWPYLSPYDFVTWLHGIFGGTFWVRFIVSTWFTRFTITWAAMPTSGFCAAFDGLHRCLSRRFWLSGSLLAWHVG